MNNDRSSARVALVTGAAGAMGRAIATRLARDGARIVVNDTDEARLSPLVDQLRGAGAKVMAIGADVTSAAAVSSMFDTVARDFGNVSILVNNAGILRPTRFLDISVDEWQLVVGVNLTGTFLCSQAALPQMLAGGWGRIVNLSSTAGKSVSTMGGAHYTAAKAGVLGLTRAIAKEVAAHSITANAVCPGLIDTDMVRATISEERAQAYADSFPIPRLGHPEEVADLIAFLASDQAAYVTGASYDITGGDLMV
jgi:NAD(P)-dependent dehydrogenase (short-subunit alcohol dehydrogenase family)